MEKVILSKRNCHRASVVQNIKNPEWGTWAFHYKAQELMQGRYAHVVGMGANSKVLHTENMSDWEVVSWKYDVTLDEYWDLAYRAFYWTSFNPDRAGERTIISYEKELNDDLKNIPLEEQERYISNYKKYFSAWLSAHSNCASSAITGGSGFNVRKAEKANNREHARMGEFIQWREKALKAIAKCIENNKPEEQKQNEEWARLEKDILHSAAIIHGINTGVERGYHKALFVSSIYGKVETYAKRGDTKMVQKAIDCIRQFNETMSIVITERHKFFKLLDVAETAKEKQIDKANRENTEIAFEGGTVVKNYSEDRLQILFDSKPAPDVISNLKSYGFRWSPRFMAWQRQLTTNAYFAAAKVIPVTYEQLTQAK
ncbi:hypothetical protein M2451_002631 [Dysgonomonas sp. PFB1-18]|uniref:hypothetical protein n=1 Tax=unclassified Dysgonomonas TaxID=2630389 RepID=UPI002475AAC3|nr:MULTISPECIES: hypothetical protein [unclassified Dysgonomonas]MDH6308112.1 hypothetical protein [Dysgonomonas sp. PF1-14]MDH6339651.1 hypothetical protein [Dysgonomonas sp. PF1-16]MDH6381302.1 hypothetical protein [Dysgonomonas sp. PFB1-18]MDH6398514.1 hypothetical protein [Dysgonomonas sp. PF1-23]